MPTEKGFGFVLICSSLILAIQHGFSMQLALSHLGTTITCLCPNWWTYNHKKPTTLKYFIIGNLVTILRYLHKNQSKLSPKVEYVARINVEYFNISRFI